MFTEYCLSMFLPWLQTGHLLPYILPQYIKKHIWILNINLQVK